ncbi:5114_t:CDS:2, partial [Scutellospora calospora]
MSNLPYRSNDPKKSEFLKALDEFTVNLECISIVKENQTFLNLKCSDKTSIQETINETFKDSINVIDFGSLGHSAPILSFIIDFDDPDQQIYDYFRSKLGDKYENLSKVKEITFLAEIDEFLTKYAENKTASSMSIKNDMVIAASNLFLQILQQNTQLQAYKRGNKMDEGTWAKITVDCLVEASV